MTNNEQLLREAAQQALEDLSMATSFISIKSHYQFARAILALRPV